MDKIDRALLADLESRIPHGKVRTRFAPSPTGYMHIGNLRTAIYTYLISKSQGGTFILRIEDTDQTRFVEGATEVIYRSLKRAGLRHDEGPDVGGPVGPYIQSERKGVYGDYARLLVERGAAYFCFCDKSEHNDEDAPQKHECSCPDLSREEIEARLAAGEPYAIRQKMPREGSTTFTDAVFGEITVENKELEDQILLKRDGLPTYNFANVIDDHLMGITHVVRGTEYLSSAPKYNLLYQAFGWDVPTYVHCSPVMRDAQHKMSKRNGDPSYEDLLNEGYLSDAIVNYVALLGWSPGGEQEIYSLDELTKIFNIGGLSKSPAIFDKAKLSFINSEYIKKLTPDEFLAEAEPYIRQAVKNPALDPALIAPLLQQRCEVLSEIPEKLTFFDELPEYSPELYVHKKMKTTVESSLETLKDLRPIIEKVEIWDAEHIHAALFAYIEKKELKNGFVLWPLRTALSGEPVSPGGGVELCHILGKEESLRRIDKGIELLSK